MADEKQTLRAMAQHRGLTLKASRRRKPGGDFGRYGLVDAGGKAVVGIGDDGLTATAGEVEAYLRDAAMADWKGSTKGLPKRKTPRPAPVPKPKPKPKFRPKVENIFAALPAATGDEVFTDLLSTGGVRVERIVSAGQVTPEDTPMCATDTEWVIVLAGEARMRIEDSEEVTLKSGDHLTIAAGQRHWVTATSKRPKTVWLAVHVAGKPG